MNGVLATPYAAAKAGVEQLGRALRVELAPHGASAGVAYFGFVDTELVKHLVDGDPLGQRFEEKFPKLLSRRISPGEAGEAIARGIERRAPRTIAPRRWAPLSVLRGILNPIVDARLERDAEILEIVRQGDLDGRLAGREVVTQPALKSTKVPSSSDSRASGS